MITTINLVDVHHLIYYIFFLVIRSFKIYNLINFQIYNPVLLTIVIILYAINTFLTVSFWVANHSKYPGQSWANQSSWSPTVT